MNPNPRKYPAPMIVLHWLMAVLVIIAYTTGGNPVEYGGIVGEIHVLSGILVGILFFVRIPVRFVLNRRTPRVVMTSWARKSAAIVQGILYLLMLIVPVLGWLALSGDIDQFTAFGINIPLGQGVNWDVGDVHETLGNVFITLAGLHAVAALLHHYVLKDDVLKTMLPFKK